MDNSFQDVLKDGEIRHTSIEVAPSLKICKTPLKVHQDYCIEILHWCIREIRNTILLEYLLTREDFAFPYYRVMSNFLCSHNIFGQIYDDETALTAAYKILQRKPNSLMFATLVAHPNVPLFAINANGQTALMLACANNDVASVRLIFDAYKKRPVLEKPYPYTLITKVGGPPPNCAADDLKASLAIAMKLKDPQIHNILEGKQNTHSSDLYTKLHSALKQTQFHPVEQVIKKVAPIIENENFDPYTAFEKMNIDTQASLTMTLGNASFLDALSIPTLQRLKPTIGRCYKITRHVSANKKLPSDEQFEHFFTTMIQKKTVASQEVSPQGLPTSSYYIPERKDLNTSLSCAF